MNRPATSLNELLLVLVILGIVLTLAAPQARRGLDGLAVRAARETAFGMAMRARALALARGGADLIFDVSARTVSAADAAGAVAAVAQLGPDNIVMVPDGASPRIVLHYDAHGIGRMASRTIRFRRGSAEAGLTFSAFGRARRW